MNHSSNYDVWGPRAWYQFHKEAINYPTNPSARDIRKAIYFYYKKFLIYVKCRNCRNDYNQLMHDYPIRLNSRLELFSWSVDIHNVINAKLNKPQITHDKAYQIWSNVISEQRLRSRYHRSHNYPHIQNKYPVYLIDNFTYR